MKNCDKKYLGRSTSEAQLKIKEIENRAMNRYLSKRERDYLPKDSSTPYYYYHQYRQPKNTSKKF